MTSVLLTFSVVIAKHVIIGLLQEINNKNIKNSNNTGSKTCGKF